MRRAPARALVPLVALLLATLTACGGSSDDGAAPEGEATASAEPSATAPSEPADPSDPSDPAPDGEGPAASADDGVPDETLSAEDLAPPDGEFTEEQRDYLAERVPTGVEPGAILDLGMAACDRLGYLSRHDPAAAAPAVEAGEIPGAEAAVEHLCPEHAELLAPTR
ncbi:hypothetical protein [Streptomyces profundus]|uniref:hypothetical protein n=1 Tax=Streptomyces profundus TaxID=2867410 RepID=UPI001D166B3B|nr:hypothetical protein [Streptomyces sp. MA3_2.13]UED83832.1 hypothetical protein K4G22_06060 [Streptomyces sp. MA3_2.13]